MPEIGCDNHTLPTPQSADYQRLTSRPTIPILSPSATSPQDKAASGQSADQTCGSDQAVPCRLAHPGPGATAGGPTVGRRTPRPVIRERLGNRAWIVSEVDVAFADFVNRVDLGEFDEVEESLGIVSLVVEAEAIQWLKALIAELPRMPVPMDDTQHIAARTRDIQNADDLALVERFLARLPEQVKW